MSAHYNAINEAIYAINSAANRLETIKECSPEYAVNEDIQFYRSKAQKLEALKAAVPKETSFRSLKVLASLENEGAIKTRYFNAAKILHEALGNE
jgi:hypothetical protein